MKKLGMAVFFLMANTVLFGQVSHKYAKELNDYIPQAIKGIDLMPYYDYDEALRAAKAAHKPVMVYFNGIHCTNCREMETKVWMNPLVTKRLKGDFIIAWLSCDATMVKLPANEQYYSAKLNKKIETLGWKNDDIEVSKFGSDSQASYYFVNGNGKKIVQDVYGYNPDVQKFIAYLDEAKVNFKNKH